MLDAAVLHRRVGTAEVMRAQLADGQVSESEEIVAQVTQRFDALVDEA